MQTIAQLKATIEIDDARFVSGIRRDNEELKKTEQQAEKTGNAFNTLASKVSGLGARMRLGPTLTAGITLPLSAAAIASVKFASDLNESLSKSSVVFGKSADDIKQWAQTSATAMGLSRQEAVESAATIGNLIVSLGLGSDKAAGMSKSIIQLAGDLASFNNVSPDEAFQAIRSGLVGETEPLRRFGVNLNEATIQTEALKMGLISSTKDAITPAIRAQAAYALIMEQTKTAQGDFALTSGGLANQQRILQASFKDLLATVGTEFLPVATRVVHWANDFLQQLQQMPKWERDTALGIAGILAAIGPGILIFTGTVRILKQIKDGLEAFVLIKDAVVAAWTGKTAAVVAHTAALEADTTAAVANTAANTTGAGAGILRGAGTIGAVIGVGVGAYTATRAIAKSSGYDDYIQRLVASDTDNPNTSAYRERQQVRQTDEALANYQRQGLFTRPAVANQIKILMQQGLSESQARQEVLRAREGGQGRIDRILAAQQPVTPLAATSGVTLSGSDLAKVQDAQFAAQIEAARSSALGAPESRRAQAEAQKLIPELQQRTKQLQERAKSMGDVEKLSAEDRVKYYQIERDISQTQAQAQQLENAAQRERESNTKHAQDQARDAQEKQRQVVQHQIELQKQAAQYQRELVDTQRSAQSEWIQLQVDQAKDGESASKAAELAIPQLQQQQKEILASIRNTNPRMKEYWDGWREVTRIERDITALQANASKERESNLEKAKQDQEKSLESQRKAFATANQTRDLQTNLTEALLRNNPFLNDFQRQRLLVPSLIREYRGLSASGPGETETEGLQRQIQQQGILGRIFESLGITGRNRMGMPNPRALNALMAQLNAPPTRDEARQLARVTAGDKPVVFQITVAPRDREELRKEFERFYGEAEKQLFPAPYATP